jgi:hypothetical protein
MFHSRKRLVVVIASGLSALGLAAIALSMALGVGRVHANTPADDGVGTPPSSPVTAHRQGSRPPELFRIGAGPSPIPRTA